MNLAEAPIMAVKCDEADRSALAEIGAALSAECASYSGESREGRLRLVQNINTKLIRLGAPVVEAEANAHSSNSRDLIERAIHDDALCAHTRNFLQMALSRLERFDLAWLSGLPQGARSQVEAAMSEQPHE
ncbi:MAG: hypothetical protein EON93_11210 [Burkholderiales bacterium]|nr:MAG: hypothetical protein EON93_11210 [Burkholderiales bacterium]